MTTRRPDPPAPTTSWSGERRSFPTTIRQRILKRDQACRNCGSPGPLQADHIVSHAEAVRLGWTQQQIDHEDNGQALCVPCHDAKTARERAAALTRRRMPVRTRRPHPGLIA